MTETMHPQRMLPLSPVVIHILLALADRERHGYAIMQEIAQDSQGKLLMGPGTLYGAVKRMLAAGLIVEAGERPDPRLDDHRRRYYRLSDFGRQVLALEIERMDALVALAKTKMPARESSQKAGS